MVVLDRVVRGGKPQLRTNWDYHTTLCEMYPQLSLEAAKPEIKPSRPKLPSKWKDVHNFVGLCGMPLALDATGQTFDGALRWV